jgi:hypothetical protein
VLPRKNLKVVDAPVFWPTADDPLFPLVGVFPFPSSDHRLVWIDVRIPEAHSGHDDDEDDDETRERKSGPDQYVAQVRPGLFQRATVAPVTMSCPDLLDAR